MVAYPEGWKECSFKDTGIEVLKGKIITRANARTGKIPVIAGGKEPAYYCDKYNRDGTTITISASGANAGYVNLYGGKIFASDCSTISEATNYDIRYIYYLLLNKQNEIYDAQTGGAQPHIHPKDIYKLSIVYTSDVSEQQAIASILSDFDEHINNLTKLIEKKKNIRDGALEDLTSGKTRLDGFNGEWEECIIEDCAYIYQGGTPNTNNSKYWNGDIVWLTPGEITNNKGMFISDSERKITLDGIKNSSAVILPKGTILLCTRATIGTLAISEKELATNQGFKNLFCKPNTSNIFLAYLLLTKKEEMISRAIGTTFLEISKKELSKMEICIPPLPEQQAIAEILTAMDEEIEALEIEKAKMEGIKEGAMDDLLTGRVRLKI